MAGIKSKIAECRQKWEKAHMSPAKNMNHSQKESFDTKKQRSCFYNFAVFIYYNINHYHQN